MLGIAGGTTLLLLAATVLLPEQASAQNEPVWPVTHRLLGADGEKSEDVSGIACSSTTGFPRSCLIIDDETQAAQLVIVKNGEILAGDPISLHGERFDGQPVELDGEAVAYDGGFFYVLGSHGHPRDRKGKLDPIRDAAKIAAGIKGSSKVFRIRIDPDHISPEGKLQGIFEVTSSVELRKILLAQPELKSFVDKRLDESGLTAEGLAILNGRFYVGLRSPVLNGRQAALVSADMGSLFEGRDANSKLHVLDLGAGRGVRDLVAFDGGFLVLAGPAGDQEGLYSIFFWDGAEGKKLLKDLPIWTGKKGRQVKAEAILPLDRNDEGLRVLLMFDGPKEGAPRPIRMGYP